MSSGSVRPHAGDADRPLPRPAGAAHDHVADAPALRARPAEGEGDGAGAQDAEGAEAGAARQRNGDRRPERDAVGRPRDGDAPGRRLRHQEAAARAVAVEHRHAVVLARQRDGVEPARRSSVAGG
jgi:hypothetical protein